MAGCLTLALVSSLSLPLRAPVCQLDASSQLLNQRLTSPFAQRTPQYVSENRFCGFGEFRRLGRAGKAVSFLQAETSQSDTDDKHSSEAANEAISEKVCS